MIKSTDKYIRHFPSYCCLRAVRDIETLKKSCFLVRFKAKCFTIFSFDRSKPHIAAKNGLADITFFILHQILYVLQKEKKILVKNCTIKEL